MNSIEDPTIKDMKRMTKVQLIEFIFELQVHHMQMKDRGDALLTASKKRITQSDDRLAQAEAHVEQARGMIESITEKWYHYE